MSEDAGDGASTLLLLGGREPLLDSIRADAHARGWSVTDDERRDADIAIAFAPPTDIHRFAGFACSAAVVGADEHGWARSGALDAARSVVALSDLARRRIGVAWAEGIAETAPEPSASGSGFLEALIAQVTAPRVGTIGVATCVRARHQAEQWGDTHLARGLMRAFRRRGHHTTELIRPDWGSERAERCDVVVHLRGLHRRPVAPGQVNVLWVISHPERVELDECEEYDIVASASAMHAAELSEALGRSVAYLPQATDADTFRPGRARPEFAADIVYVGNNRWPARRGPRWLLRIDRPFLLYGSAWEGSPEAVRLVDTHVPNRDLPDLYRSARVVVADHHGPMRHGGFIANRLFDVLAAGGVVVSDDVNGIDELFGELVPTYATPAELEQWLDELLQDERGRLRRARAGRAFVESAHTLDHRAVHLLDLLTAHAASTGADASRPDDASR